MGYGFTCIAGAACDSMLRQLRGPSATAPASSNTWIGKDGAQWFYEENRRDHADGGVSGTVRRVLPDGVHCVLAGSVRITGSGIVTRWPGSTAAQRSTAARSAIATERRRKAHGFGDHLRDLNTRTWDRACRFDGIQPRDPFAVFSPGNPWAERNNRIRLLIVEHVQLNRKIA